MPSTYKDLLRPISKMKKFKPIYSSEITSQETSFKGASQSSQSMRNYNAPIVSESEAIYERETLIERSIDMHKNNLLGGAAVETCVTNVIGTGLNYQADIDSEFLNLSESKKDDIEAMLERKFNAFAGSKNFDASRMNTFYDTQRILFLNKLLRGDAMSLKRHKKRKGTYQTLCFQMIDTLRLSSPISIDNKIIGGVEVDSDGEPTFYHIKGSYNGGYYDEFKTIKIPAFGGKSGLKNVLHLFQQETPGQRRGLPYLAPIIENLKNLDRYEEAEVVAAVVNGYFTALITSDFAEEEGGMGGISGLGSESVFEDPNLGAGTIGRLKPGESVTSLAPNRPNNNFEAFWYAMSKAIAARLQQPLEMILKHFSSSYSASRGALLEAWRFYMTGRQFMATDYCQEVFDLWLYEEVANNRIVLPGFLENEEIRKAYCKSKWIGTAKGELDPLKEAKAAEILIENSISTINHESSLRGSDFTSNHKQRAKEKRMRVKDGLELPVGEKQSRPEGFFDDEEEKK